MHSCFHSCVCHNLPCFSLVLKVVITTTTVVRLASSNKKNVNRWEDSDMTPKSLLASNENGSQQQLSFSFQLSCHQLCVFESWSSQLGCTVVAKKPCTSRTHIFRPACLIGQNVAKWRLLQWSVSVPHRKCFCVCVCLLCTQFASEHDDETARVHLRYELHLIASLIAFYFTLSLLIKSVVVILLYTYRSMDCHF